MKLPREIDLRGLTETCRTERVREVIDELADGESVVFVSDRDLSVILADARVGGRDGLQYCALEDGAGTHSLELRRAARERTLSELLEFDHARLDKLLSDVEWRLEQRRVPEAVVRFAQLRAALERHMHLEEVSIFPLAARLATPEQRQILASLTREHDVMRELLETVARVIHREDEDARAALSSLSDLREVLGPHGVREQRYVAPLIDRGEGRRVRASLHQMHAL